MKDERLPRLHQDDSLGANAHPVPPETMSYRVMLRKLKPILGSHIGSLDAGVPLELLTRAEPPVITEASRLEKSSPTELRDVRPMDTEIDAFLDGIQRTTIVTHVDSVPIVHGLVAAVIRIRRSRRMQTWRQPRLDRALYLPRALVSGKVCRALEDAGLSLVDTSNDADAAAHPMAMRRSAVDAVGSAREQLERDLVTSWFHSNEGWLWVDGGVSGVAAIRPHSLEATRIFGVVKSHATLYGDPGMIASTLRLDEGQRSAAFLIRHRVRSSVVSWYLRLRCSSDGDPLHGLVRVEILAPAHLDAALANNAELSHHQQDELSELADRISGWILAERLPVALPDSRWDRMTYGIHDCESFLDALAGLR